ncbi:uncharacterized protein LOC118507822 isoform X2 [Anopheles stephensi]|uniref:uncharacterized protein LOC118507822 isoform X2 n=1 Tax=Anopheles stephensi TaxID=30069 RepID=UPI0016589A76|nr:uncharacterized protein LOC118507822 isoform X2 [Anopheles stephensi]
MKSNDSPINSPILVILYFRSVPSKRTRNKNMSMFNSSNSNINNNNKNTLGRRKENGMQKCVVPTYATNAEFWPWESKHIFLVSILLMMRILRSILPHSFPKAPENPFWSRSLCLVGIVPHQADRYGLVGVQDHVVLQDE